jgi:hypothetical protein
MTMPTETQPYSLTILNSFLGVVEQNYVEEPDINGGRFIQVLKIYRWHLQRAARGIAATVDQLGTLKHGVRTAERILESLAVEDAEDLEGWYLGCNPANNIQRFANVLWSIIMALTAEIVETERQYPALKELFDNERAEYRRMKEAADG